MAHETILFGVIVGSSLRDPPGYQLLQQHNHQVIEALPGESEYPFPSRGMFLLPDLGNRTVVFRRQPIAFGHSVKGLEFDDTPVWLEKFERLLARLYWLRVELIVAPEIMVEQRYRYQIDDSIVASYQAGDPQPTSVWSRAILSGDVAGGGGAIS